MGKRDCERETDTGGKIDVEREWYRRKRQGEEKEWHKRKKEEKKTGTGGKREEGIGHGVVQYDVNSGIKSCAIKQWNWDR